MDTLTNTPMIDAPLRARPVVPSNLRQMEADHRIADNLQIAASTLMRERRQIDSVAAAKAAMEAMAARLVSISRLHRILSQIDSEGEVALGTYLATLRDGLAECIGTRLELDVGAVELPALVAAQIGVVVSEMATNSAKHARRDGADPILTVVADTNGLGEVRLRLHDDGPGFPDGFTLDHDCGIGMTIVTSTIERLGGYVYLMPRFGPYHGIGAGLEIVLPPLELRSA